jgi:DNA polymerase-3 subunit gamma/tau
VRLAYAADLPTPDEALKAIGNGTGGGTPARESAPVPSGAPRARMMEGGNAVARAVSEPAEAQGQTQLRSLEDVLALADKHRDIQIKHALKNFVRLVKLEEGKLEISMDPGAPANLAGTLGAKLSQWAGRRWLVIVSREKGGATLAERERETHAQLKADVRSDPAVQALFSHFPGAEIVEVRKKRAPEQASDADDFDAPIEDDEA